MTWEEADDDEDEDDEDVLNVPIDDADVEFSTVNDDLFALFAAADAEDGFDDACGCFCWFWVELDERLWWVWLCDDDDADSEMIDASSLSFLLLDATADEALLFGLSSRVVDWDLDSLQSNRIEILIECVNSYSYYLLNIGRCLTS